MQDPIIIYLSNRIDTLEKNQREILELLKRTLTQNKNPSQRHLNLVRNFPLERRTQPRKPVSVPISFEYSHDQRTISHYGKSFNISESGLCFYTQTPLRAGLNLRVHSEHIWDSPKLGIVKWCNRKYLNFYQVGVSLQ